MSPPWCSPAETAAGAVVEMRAHHAETRRVGVHELRERLFRSRDPLRNAIVASLPDCTIIPISAIPPIPACEFYEGSRTFGAPGVFATTTGSSSLSLPRPVLERPDMRHQFVRLAAPCAPRPPETPALAGAVVDDDEGFRSTRVPTESEWRRGIAPDRGRSEHGEKNQLSRGRNMSGNTLVKSLLV